MKKGLWSQKELKILLWALAIHSEHTGRGIDEFVNINKFYQKIKI